MQIPLLHTTPTQKDFSFPEGSKLEQPELLYPGRKPVGNVEIDWTHPLAKEIRFAWIAQEQTMGQHLLDLTGLNKTKSWSGPVHTGRQVGVEVYTREVQIARSNALEPDYVTLIAKVNVSISDTGVSGDYRCILSKDKDTWASPYYSYGLRVRRSSFNRLEFVYNDGTTNRSLAMPVDSFQWDTDIWVVASYGSDSSLLRVYDEAGNLLQEVNGSGGAEIAYFNTDLHIGDTHTNTLRSMAGPSRIYDIFIWGDVINADFSDNFVRDPYQFLKPVA